MERLFRVRTNIQAALYELELKGQFSDGHWENCSSIDFRPWCEAKAVVAAEGEKLGPSWFVSRNYNFSDNGLLDCVGERMMRFARLATKYSVEDIETIKWRCDGVVTFPTYVDPEGSGNYWAQEKAKLQAFLDKHSTTLEQLNALAGDVSVYDSRQLRKDLNEMKSFCRQPKPAPMAHEVVPGTTIRKPKLKLVGTDGNAFAIIGRVSSALRSAGCSPEVVRAYRDKATSGDYSGVLATSCDYVDVR